MDIDDNASIASTIEEEADPDAEFPVKQILAEGQVGGRTMYLLEWENYPLSAASWEPKENIQGDMLEDWYRTKQKQEEGQIPKFDIDEWRMALIQHVRDKYARHEMRNRERQRRGLEVGHFTKTLEQFIAEVNATPSDLPQVASESVHQTVTANAPKHTAQHAEVSGERSPPSSIDGLFSESDSELKFGSSSGNCHLGSEEDLTVSSPSTKPKLVEDAAIQRSECSPQRVAGIAIDSIENMASDVLANQAPGTLSGHARDAASDLGSDAMDIDDESGHVLPGRSSPNRGGDHNSLRESRSVKTIAASSNSIQPFPEASLAAGKSSLLRGGPRNVEENQKRGVSSTLASMPIKPLKRVSFSLAAPIKEKPSSKSESSLFVPNHCQKQASSTSSSKMGTLISSKSNSAEEKYLQGRSNTEESLPKTCVIGSVKLACSFHVSSPPENSQMRLYAEIMDLEEFQFSHVCTAQDVIWQLRASELSSGPRVTGTACSHFQADKLETVLNCLHSSSFGLFCHNDGFCLMMYPSKCADWQQHPLPTSTPPTGHLLRYLAFATAPKFRVCDISLEYSLPYSSGIGIFDKQLYRKLLPSNDQFDKTQPVLDSFFLVFPPSAKPEEDLLCRWLRVFNRNCEIRSCAVSGHWAKFVDGLRGAVILHQDCVQLLHRLPHFSKLLHSRNEDYNFWIFRLPFCSPVSEQHFMDEYLEQVGIALDWAFPPGIAVMAPPSFFLSQPTQAYNMLKWIWQNFSAEAPVYRHGKLVVCHNMDDWLLNLMLEKSKASLEAREPKQILEVRMKTFMLMKKLLGQDNEEISSPVVYAPRNIDGNDEQSLVNWFGWWSVSQVHKFRKFTVICSDNEDDKRLSRYIERATLREMFSAAYGLGGTTSTTQRASPTLVTSDTPDCLSAYIRSVSNDAHASLWNPLVICPWPLVQHEGTSQYGDASQWVNFFAEHYILPLLNGKAFAKKKNTAVGFFYLVDGTPYQVDRLNVQPAHAWLAFVRPMELHRKPWKYAELLFWDFRLRDVAHRSQTISESDLSSAQRNLITEVTKKYAKMNLPLGKVWAGGFKASKMHPHPLDITLDWMKAMVANVKSWLPLNHDDLLNRGWSLVRSRSSPSMSHSPALSRYAASSGGAETGDNEATQIILFDPPNSSSADSIPYKNRLYQWAMADRVSREFEYTYVPTLEWYREQQESGRGFEHIRVLSWKEFFEHYRIDDPEK
ncbi:Chromo domain [Cordyceps militaris]|uniref:Chromo domain n=1 Tax=Cordyceps militaris TaxID=73501 RepID=A0A2H4SJA4_CORMI|nr:Chromo domain [Cordyceps militaris]